MLGSAATRGLRMFGVLHAVYELNCYNLCDSILMLTIGLLT